MKATRLFSAMVVLFVSTTAIGAAAPKGAVGKRGEIGLLTFSGNKHFTADELRAGLDVDPEVLSAAHRQAPLAAYLEALRRQIAVGYRYAGFHDVKIDVALDDDGHHIVATIVEGTQYKAGEVRVHGAKALPAQDLVRWLAEVRPGEKAERHDPDTPQYLPSTWIGRKGFPVKQESPLWKAGDVAQLRPDKLDDIKKTIRRAYSEVGRRNPRFDIQIDHEGEAAILVVNIRDEGPPAIVGETEITGADKNSFDDVIQFLGAKRGDLFDRTLQSRLERALWYSARFAKYKVEFVEGSGKADPVGWGTLAITLTEFDGAPLLTEKLSAEEAALLKLRLWLVGCGARNQDIVVSLSGLPNGSFEFIISPGRGLLADVKLRLSDDGELHSFGFLSTAERLGLYDFNKKEKIEFTPTESQWIIESDFDLSGNTDQPFYLRTGMGVNNGRVGVPRQALTMRNRFPPVLALAMAHAEKGDNPVVCKIRDGVLAIQSSGVEFRSHAGTGELLGVSLLDPADPDAEVSIKVKNGLLTERLNRLQAKANACKNRFDDAQPWMSSLQFIAGNPGWDEFAAGEPQLKSLVGIVRKALAADLVPPVVTTVQAVFEEESGRFRIPLREPTSVTHEDNLAQLMAGFAQQLPRLADQFFPRDSWAWKQTREFGLAAAGHRQFVADELERAARVDRWGPLACRCLSLGGEKFFDLPDVAAPAAERGLKSLTTADFRRDYEALISPKHLSGQLARGFVQFLRSLDEEEAAVLSSFGEANLPGSVAIIELLRSDTTSSLEAALPTALEQAWKTGLQQRLAERLRSQVK